MRLAIEGVDFIPEMRNSHLGIVRQQQAVRRARRPAFGASRQLLPQTWKHSGEVEGLAKGVRQRLWVVY